MEFRKLKLHCPNCGILLQETRNRGHEVFRYQCPDGSKEFSVEQIDMGEEPNNWTTRTLFEEVIKVLREEGEYPEDLVDYALPVDEGHAVRITNPGSCFVTAITKYGGSEGIYTDLYLKGAVNRFCDEGYYQLGTIKCLPNDRQSLDRMYTLAGNFYYHAEDILCERYDDIEREHIVFKGKNGTVSYTISVCNFLGISKDIDRELKERGVIEFFNKEEWLSYKIQSAE